MAALTIEDLDPLVEEGLRLQAAAHNRTIEAEAHDILRHTVRHHSLDDVASEEALLQRRRVVADRFLSGEWGADLEGFEEGRATDRAQARAGANLWR